MELLTLEGAALCNVMGPEERELFPWDEEIYYSVFSIPATREGRCTLAAGRRPVLLHFCSKGAEKAGMTHCSVVGWEWSPLHHLGQVRATLAWHGRRKNSADLFHCNRDITEYPHQKKLTVSELEKGGTGYHQPILKIFMACSTGCCWLLIWFQVCAVLQDYKVLTCCLLVGFWQCGAGDGFTFSQLLFLSEVPSAEWEGGNREQHMATPLALEKFMGWWHWFVVPLLVTLHLCSACSSWCT